MSAMRRTWTGLGASLALTAIILAGSLPAAAAGPTGVDPSVSPAPPPDLASAVLTLADAAQPSAVRLPVCRYVDLPTRFDKVRDWRKTLLDTNLRITSSYEPWDLVLVSKAGLAGSGRVRKVMLADLTALAVAADRSGKPLAVKSAYRSYATQVATFNMWVQRSGYEQALRFSARPGHSEHQLGTTIDFTTAPGVPLSTTFGDSPAGRWLARNSWKYGFIMSYPKGKERASCYGYEPWHFRYFGRAVAAQIHESGQVPRRFLWENYESR
jgi:zinc D-Ala-D-Ala carboxypeptidase